MTIKIKEMELLKLTKNNKSDIFKKKTLTYQYKCIEISGLFEIFG